VSALSLHRATNNPNNVLVHPLSHDAYAFVECAVCVYVNVNATVPVSTETLAQTNKTNVDIVTRVITLATRAALLTLPPFHSPALSLSRPFTLPPFHSPALSLSRPFTLPPFHSPAHSLSHDPSATLSLSQQHVFAQSTWPATSLQPQNASYSNFPLSTPPGFGPSSPQAQGRQGAANYYHYRSKSSAPRVQLQIYEEISAPER
jgi:hypothetical protein